VGGKKKWVTTRSVAEKTKIGLCRKSHKGNWEGGPEEWKQGSIKGSAAPELVVDRRMTKRGEIRGRREKFGGQGEGN